MKTIEDIYKFAKKENIPIMLDDGISFLLEFIEKNKIKNILEIGSAIGYSAIKMASLDSNIKVVTLERDEIRYNIALENIKELHLENQININLIDAFDFDTEDEFDLIFIDAAKGKNIDFFEKFKKNLKKGGYIITDNLKFHGMVDKNLEEIESRNVRGLVRKIRNYVDFLKDNMEFKTEFYEIGDGISVSEKV